MLVLSMSKQRYIMQVIILQLEFETIRRHVRSMQLIFKVSQNLFCVLINHEKSNDAMVFFSFLENKIIDTGDLIGCFWLDKIWLVQADVRRKN